MRKKGELLKGRYLIERELGRGGIAVVYLAHDRKLYDKPVVVKMLRDDHEDNANQDWYQRKFREEVEALARINHGGVVSVLDTDETIDGLPYMVMEYVAGKALREAMNAIGMEFSRVAGLMRQISRALMSAHERGVIHRDLKPENIMLQTSAEAEETIKLIDFGIATVKKQVNDDTWVKTAIAGTVFYMAPEQLRGKPLPASDVYALGVIAYELVTGSLPFRPSSPYELLDLQRAGVRVPPKVLRPDLPLAAQSVILQALSFEPENRPRSPREFGDQLAQSLNPTTVRSVGGQLPVGAFLNERYRIIRRLGGSVTSVYLGEDFRQSRRQVVIKELTERADDDVARQALRLAFNRESDCLKRLTHSALPAIYDFFSNGAQGRHYLVTELIAGVDLGTRLREAGGRLSELNAVQWASEICDALVYLHEQQPPVIYRDLHPTNVMIETQTQRVKLTDFGLMRIVAPPIRGMTAFTALGYVAPEVIRGKAEPRSDVYAIGALLFHMVTGCDPTDTPLMIFDFTRNPSPRQLMPELSVELERLICQSVEFKAENRIASVLLLRQALKEHLVKLQISSATTLVTEAKKETRCQYCNHLAGQEAIFCSVCGQRLQVLQAKLIIQANNEPVFEWLIDGTGETTLGRVDPQQGIYPKIDLTKHDPTSSVSRRHALIWVREEHFWLKDLNSANGTFINNNNRLANDSEHLLKDDTELRLGDVRLKFVRLF